MDVMTPAQRSRCMAAIRSKHTKPEMVVRKIVRSLGHAYRLHVASLPGCPDLVFRKHRKAIIVHGCFFHRHACKLGRPVPATRREFWVAKLEGNKKRDGLALARLRKLGWATLTVWECQTRRVNQELVDRIAKFLQS